MGQRLSAPLTAASIENEILRLMYLLEERTDELAARARTAAESESNHKAMWAMKFLEADGTESKRKALADAQTHSLYQKRKIDEATHGSCRESIFTIRMQIDSLRTLAANVRAQT